LTYLSETVFHESDDLTKYSNSATRISIRIIYDNGDFIVLCSNEKTNFVTLFIADGNVGEIIARFIGQAGKTDNAYSRYYQMEGGDAKVGYALLKV